MGFIHDLPALDPRSRTPLQVLIVSAGSCVCQHPSRRTAESWWSLLAQCAVPVVDSVDGGWEESPRHRNCRVHIRVFDDI